MGIADNWAEESLEPLSMYELGKWWIDSLKVLGAGNGAGVIALGAALNYFSAKPDVLFTLKMAAACFLIGVITFAASFVAINFSLMAYDDYAHAIGGAVKEGRPEQIMEEARGLRISTTTNMNRCNYLAAVSVIAFFFGCGTAFIALVRL